jgi:hypothetical protein
MVRDFFNNIITNIIIFFAGKRAKGQTADYPTIGEIKVQSTCMPDDKLDFNTWTSNFERIKTGN